jgi:branched-chain amino acid transport system permease protein
MPKEGRLMADSATAVETPVNIPKPESRSADATTRMVFIGLGILLLVAPFLLYPVFLMKVLCFALFACAFNLLLGYGGLLSFGHAAYFGMASYVSAYTAKFWGITPELSILLGTAAAAVLASCSARSPSGGSASTSP